MNHTEPPKWTEEDYLECYPDGEEDEDEEDEELDEYENWEELDFIMAHWEDCTCSMSRGGGAPKPEHPYYKTRGRLWNIWKDPNEEELK